MPAAEKNLSSHHTHAGTVSQNIIFFFRTGAANHSNTASHELGERIPCFAKNPEFRRFETGIVFGHGHSAGADIAVADTGIAGPGGGTPDKPVGLVWIAVSTAKGARAERNLFAGSRETVKLRASQSALALLRKTALEEF